MLTEGESVEIDALVKRGWSVSAIARHLGRDPKTVRSYLSGDTQPGVRRGEPCPLGEYVPYLQARFSEDNHVRATVLYDEVRALGYELSYQSFTRHLRDLDVRPHCEACAGVKGRATIEIGHPPGEEIQWDWVELPDAPWASTAHLLVGVLPHSSKCRAVFAESEDQPHLIWAIDGVLRRFGGTPWRWRVDRMSTVIVPGSDDVQASFAPVAKHYGVGIDPCPARAANRKGAVEKAIDYITQRWWRTAEVATMAQAQQGLDTFCATIADDRERKTADGTKTTVGELAETEPLQALPDIPYPRALRVQRKVDQAALVSFEGNKYSVPHTLIGTTVTAQTHLGTEWLDIISAAGTIVAGHGLRPAGLGAIVRDREHRAALEGVILAEFTTERPCPRKPHRPPGADARAEAERLLADKGEALNSTYNNDDAVVIDLGEYGRLVNGDDAVEGHLNKRESGGGQR